MQNNCEKYRFKTIGFVLDDLGSSQTAYCLIKNINERVSKNIDPSFALFTIDPLIPCLEPLVPIYNIRDTFGFDGVLIATSARTIAQLENCTRAKRYYYVQDLKDLSSCPLHVFSNEDIKLVFRSKDYTKDERVVEDYNINKFLEMIDGDNSKRT